MKKTTNQEPRTREKGRKKLEEVLRRYFSDQELNIMLASVIVMIADKMETGDEDKALGKRKDIAEEWESDKAEGNKHIDALISIMEKWDKLLDETDKLAEEVKEELLLKHMKKENEENEKN